MVVIVLIIVINVIFVIFVTVVIIVKYKSRQLEQNDFTGLTLDVNTSENYAEMELWEGERVIITIIYVL